MHPCIVPRGNAAFAAGAVPVGATIAQPKEVARRNGDDERERQRRKDPRKSAG
jgi:hypothetical protein